MRIHKQNPVQHFVIICLLVLFKATFGLFLKFRYNLRCHNKGVIPRKGPYLLLANHCNNLDGLFLQYYIGRPISFVVTDAMFKKKTLGRLMSFVRYIPKRKHVADSGAIRKIIQAAKNNEIIGVFPEGGRNWDGKTSDISPATYRLVKLLGIPVVTARIKGSYLSEPRWADTKRRGIVEIEFQIHFADGRISSLDDIGETIKTALAHNEAVWQNIKHIPFKGKSLVKGLERLLYTCPVCKRIGTMSSTGDRLTCHVCAASFTLDIYGFLRAVNGSLPSESISDMNDWQLLLMTERFLNESSKATLLADENACLYCAESTDSPFEPVIQGTLSLTKQSMSIGCRNFETARIQGVAVYFKTHLEFRYDGLDYRVGFKEEHVSAYKWNCALDALKKNMEI